VDERGARLAAWWLAALLLVHASQRPGLAPRPGAPPPERGAARLLWGLPLDLNRDDARALEALPGIGPARAAALVGARPYCRVEELERVPGIGPVTLGRLAGRVAVSAPPAACKGRNRASGH
jgi:competence protein ComEA